MVNLGDEFPNFNANTTVGNITFHDWLGDSWCIFFSHPNSFTPVCTTELGRVAQLMPEFAKRNCKVIGCSCDDIEVQQRWIENLGYERIPKKIISVLPTGKHSRGRPRRRWKDFVRVDLEKFVLEGGHWMEICSERLVVSETNLRDIKSYSKIEGSFPYPIIADESRSLAVQLGMIDPAEKNKDGLPVTCRAVFIIDPEKKLRLTILYPATTGRNFGEILRVLDSLQLTDNKKVATPVDWKFGDSCMVLPTLSDHEATELFPAGFKTVQVPSSLPYIRITPQP